MAQRPIVNLPAPPQGIIGSLVAGFELVNARLELILLPLALDVFLWLGPHASIKPLLDELVRTLPAAGSAQQPTVFDGLRTIMVESGARFNLFSLLSTAPLGLPSLSAARSPVATPYGAPPVVYIDSVPLYVLLMGALLLGGLLLGALYLGGIAQQVRDRRLQPGVLIRQVWGDWARLTALAAMALAVLLVLGTPVLMITAVAMLLHPVAGSLVWIVGSTVILWVLFYGGFALHSMLLQRRNLFGALWDSARLVQVNLPSAAGLLLLVVLLNAGLGQVWSLPPEGSWLWLVGISGHALISTALFTATFVFYQDRYRWWTEMRQVLRARAEAEQRAAKR